MAENRFGRPSFQITHESAPSDRLIAGFSSFGLAGLTAVDFLVDQLNLEVTGHISIAELPAITPFENGTPRHHTRLFSRSDLEFTVLVNELFVPVWATDSFAEAIIDWTETNSVQDISVLSGIPLPHGPDDHRVFYIATQDYQDHQLTDSDIPAMGNGFLDGLNASLMGRGMDSALQVAVFVTPVHPQVPDVEAALRLINSILSLHDIDVNTDELLQFAQEVEQYYRGLEQRVEATDQGEAPEDQMYM